MPHRISALSRLSFVVALTAALTLLGFRPTASQAQEADLTEWEELARDILRELIEINTAHSVGGTHEASQAMADRLLAEGFPAEDVSVTEVVPGEGNMVARYRGRDTGRQPILLLAHIDVVEADPADWTLPPFTFIEQEGSFFGRGVADDKDEAAIYMANLIRMKREGYVPDRDIIVALTSDEEGGPHNGVAWLLENRRELIDAEYALNEGGGGMVVAGKRISNNVQASEKKYLNFIVEATNPGGHSSVPRPDNAIYELSKALLGIGSYHHPVNLNEVTEAFFSRSANLVEPEMGAMMRRVLEDPTDAEAAAFVSTVPGYNSRLRTSCVATLLDGGHAPNALPQRATANVNCRILPDEDPAVILERLQAAAGDAEVTIEMDGEVTNSPPSPLTPEILGTIERITEDMWPGVPVLPVMSTGATDGLYLRNAGIPVYGVSGLFFEDPNAHGMNERISTQGFYEGLEFLYRLVGALSSGQGVS